MARRSTQSDKERPLWQCCTDARERPHQTGWGLSFHHKGASKVTIQFFWAVLFIIGTFGMNASCFWQTYQAQKKQKKVQDAFDALQSSYSDVRASFIGLQTYNESLLYENKRIKSENTQALNRINELENLLREVGR